MSADDPTDDELEREAARDIPIPAGGTRHHAPRLSEVSRAINPRALLMAEQEAQSRDPREARELFDAPDLARVADAVRAPQRERQPRPLYPYEVDPDPYRFGGREPPPAMPRTPAGRFELVRELLEPPKAETKTAQREMRELAWDDYAASALASLVQLAPKAEPRVVADVAAEYADRLLEERRKRFG